MAGILDWFAPQDFMNPNNPQNQRRLPDIDVPGALLRAHANQLGPLAPAVGAEPAVMAPPAPAPIPDNPAAPNNAPRMASPDVSPPRAPMADLSRVPVQGPIINNGGTLSDVNGVTGFEPIRGTSSVMGDRELATLGYAANADNSLRRTGTPFDQQLNLMTQLQRMAEQSAPGINAMDSATRDQQAQARSQYLGNSMQNLMQHFGGQILPNQLGQDRLGLERTVQLGMPGTPGAMQNAASDAANRTRENERYGPGARHDAAFMEFQRAQPPGTPLSAVMQMWADGGGRRPEFLGGQTNQTNQGRGGGAGGVDQPAAPPNLASSTDVNRAFETGTSSFPLVNGRRVLGTDPGPRMNAISQIMSGLSDAAIRDPAVRQRLINEFGTDGPGGLDTWINAPNNILGRMGLYNDPQQDQIRRYLGLAGQQQAPVTPFSQGAGFWQRALTSIPAFGGLNQLNR